MELGRWLRNKLKSFFSPQYRMVRKWKKCDGDHTYRLDYGLNENDIVIDAGGYKGDFTAGIKERYHCNIYVFEPVPDFAKKLSRRFAGDTKVKVLCAGLSDKDEKSKICINEDGSSFFKKGTRGIRVKNKDIVSFMEENSIRHVHLLKLNIEGGEYAVLERLIESGVIGEIDNIQVQFHFIKGMNTKKRMKSIWNKLEETHRLTWSFRPYVWENWERKL